MVDMVSSEQGRGQQDTLFHNLLQTAYRVYSSNHCRFLPVEQ